MHRHSQPVAVVDIGSNSVRLVIYEGPWRHAAVLHNEKAICAIGRNMVTTGRLDAAGMEMAIETLARFRALADGHKVQDLGAVATAAARDAANGRDFIRRAERALGYPIQILSGEEEARIAAEGALAGIPDADGLVADLGGGSLDMVTVKDGRTGSAATLPFGPLRLMDASGGNLDKARAIVARSLEQLEMLNGLKGRALYAVGGIWRALAHVDMDRQDYPLRVLHHYVIPGGRAVKLCRVVSGLSRKSLEKMVAVPKRRAEALPYGAIVLEEMLRGIGLGDVVVSAYGLREGVLQTKLRPEDAGKDPLLEFARDVNRRESRSESHAVELFHWMAPLFPKEDPAERRLREAICLFSDIGWRRHPDDRAMGAFAQVLRGAYGAASHRDRALMATAIYYRYAGDGELPKETGISGLIGSEGIRLAQQIGLAGRLAFGLSAALPGELPQTALRLGRDTLFLEVPSRREVLIGETAVKRLADLAKAFDREPEIKRL